MSLEFAKVTFRDKDKISTPVDFDDLVKHLQKLGLRSPGPYDKQTSPVFLHKESLKWARFEIIESNDTVVMEVDRKDNTITRCYLSRSFDNLNEIYLQIESGLEPDESGAGEAIKNTEVHGVFPIEIKYIGTGCSSLNGNYIGFYGSDRKSGIKITWDGKVRFSSK